MVDAEIPEQLTQRRIEFELDELERRLGADERPMLAAAYMRRGIRGTIVAADDGVELSERERYVLIRYALGEPMKAIARQLALSKRTVETYLKRAQEKLHIRGRAEVIRFAIGRGWVA